MSSLAPDPPSTRGDWLAEFRATLALSWPLVLSNLAQVAMQATDVAMLGRLNSEVLAASAIGSNLYFFFLIFGIGLVLATSPMLARALGENRFAVRELRRTVRQGLWSGVILTLPVWVALWHAEAILLLLGQDRTIAALAGEYLHALQWSYLPSLVFIVLRSFVAALERPRWALGISLIAVLLNAALNWCLIYGNLGFPALGITGSGLATSCASLFMALGLAVVIITDRRFRRYHLFGRFWRADWPRLRTLWQLGIPMAATLTFEVSIFNAAAFLMGIIGLATIAAHQIAIQIASITFMVPMGVGTAATIRVGRALGAGNAEAVRRAGWVAYLLGTGFMAMMALVMVFFPLPLIGVFIDLTDPANIQVIRLAASFLVLAAIFQVVDGAQAVAIGMLRGLHDTRRPMLYAMLGYWGIGLPLGVLLAFPLKMEGVGIWIGLASGLGVVAVLLMMRWLRRTELGLVAQTSIEKA